VTGAVVAVVTVVVVVVDFPPPHPASATANKALTVATRMNKVTLMASLRTREENGVKADTSIPSIA
jgi:hypothetical protein